MAARKIQKLLTFATLSFTASPGGNHAAWLLSPHACVAVPCCSRAGRDACCVDYPRRWHR